jgi:hypothetical protein
MGEGQSVRSVLLEKLDVHASRMQRDPYLTSLTDINLKGIKDYGLTAMRKQKRKAPGCWSEQ